MDKVKHAIKTLKKYYVKKENGFYKKDLERLEVMIAFTYISKAIENGELKEKDFLKKLGGKSNG